MTRRLSLVEAERYDWQAYTCACGSAEHVPATFEQLLDAASTHDITMNSLDRHIIVQDSIYRAAVPVAAMIMAALPSDASPLVRPEILALLYRLVSGESAVEESLVGYADLAEQCQAIVREGIWEIYGELATGNALIAASMLDIVEIDRVRFAFYMDKYGKRVHA